MHWKKPSEQLHESCVQSLQKSFNDLQVSEVHKRDPNPQSEDKKAHETQWQLKQFIQVYFYNKSIIIIAVNINFIT